MLFNEYEAYSKEGGELADRIHKAIEPIIIEMIQKGEVVRDIQTICVDQVEQICLVKRVLRAMNKRIEERKKE